MVLFNLILFYAQINVVINLCSYCYLRFIKGVVVLGAVYMLVNNRRNCYICIRCLT